MITVKNAFDKFILSRKLADLAERTIRDYVEFISPFVQFLGLETYFDNIRQDDINEYIATLLERPLSRASRATYIRHIKIFLKWCESNFKVSYESKLIVVPKTPKKQVSIYTQEEVVELFGCITAEEYWLLLRNKLMIALMYDSGLRQAELCRVRCKWVSVSERRMKVHGKGDKERFVPLGSLTLQLMKQYLAECPYKSEYLLLNKHGEKLTCNAVKLMVSKLSKKLSFDISSHKLRHNFATNYCINQYEKYGRVDIYSLMYIMGHENVETTNRYLHFAMEIIAGKQSISHLDNILLNVIN